MVIITPTRSELRESQVGNVILLVLVFTSFNELVRFVVFVQL